MSRDLIKNENGKTFFPLSRMQQDYTDYEKTEEDAVSNVFGCFYYIKNAPCDEEAMQLAYREVLKRNQALRASFTRAPKGYQFFHSAEEMPGAEVVLFGSDLRELLDFCKDPEIPHISVSSEYLVSAEILLAESGEGGILIWTHHSCADGYSMTNIVYSQLRDFYEAFVSGKEPAAAKKEYLFSDAVLKTLQAEKKRRLKDFVWKWKNYNRRFVRYRLPVKGLTGVMEAEHLRIHILDADMQVFSHFVKENAVSDNAVFLAAAACVTYTQTHIERFQITTMTHGRFTAPEKKTVGPLHVALTVFMDYPCALTIREYVKKVYMDILMSAMHPPGKLEDEALIVLPRLFSGVTLWNEDWLFFNNQRVMTSDSINADMGIAFTAEKGNVRAIAVEILDEKGGVLLDIQYLKELFTREKIEELAAQYRKAVEILLMRPDLSMEQWSRGVSLDK